jgi:hypothetical protein
MMLQLDETLDKNHIIFRHNNIHYSKNISGDNITNVFNRNLMNIYLEQYEETIGIINYDNIIHISIISNKDDIIIDLPNNLVKLFLMSSKCTELVLSDQVKQTIEIIHIAKTNINKFPNINGCNKLKELKITESNISKFEINYNLPTTLTKLELYGNNINNDNFSYDRITTLLNNNSFCKINFGNNYLNYNLFPKDISHKCNLSKQFTYIHQTINIRNVNREIVREAIQNNIVNNLPNVNAQLLTSQSVHLSSVNKSVIKSIDIMLEYINSNFLIVELLDIDPLTNEELNKFINDHKLRTFKTEFLQCPTIHTISKLTYKQTFELVWTIMNNLISINKFKKKDLYERLGQEIKDSINYCFTGKYNRLINSLVGILDGVQVGISESEEAQLEFQILLGNIKKNINHEEFNEIICEAKEIVKDLPDKNIWIEALYDYAPEPLEIMYKKTNYLRTFDDLILDIHDTNLIHGVIIDGNIILFSEI